MSNTARLAIALHIAFARVDRGDAVKRNRISTVAQIEGWRATESLGVDKSDGAGERCANVTFPDSTLLELSKSSLHSNHRRIPGTTLSPSPIG